MTSYVIPPDNRSVGSGNPPQDVDDLSDMEGLLAAVLAQMAGYPGNSTVPADNAGNVTAVQTILGNASLWGLQPSGDTSGDTDTANIAGLLSLTGTAQLGIGVFYFNAQLVLPSAGQILGYDQSFGTPLGNYGAGSLNLQGTILTGTDTFANPDSATGTIYLNTSSGQGGGQRIQDITLDLSNLPDGNNLHGILIQNNTACVTLNHVTVYGGEHQISGDALHCVSSGGSPPDLLNIQNCHFTGAAGWGVSMSGAADSYIAFTESTANETGAWNIINGNNTRFAGCKGETSTGGPGWLFTFESGFTGVVHLLACTSQDNFADGFKVTGTGTGTLQMLGCSSDGDGANGGSGGGSYSGLNVTSFAGICLATGWNTRVSTSTTSPDYGVSMTSSNILTLQGGGNVAGETASYHNGGGNTSFIGTTAPGGFLVSPSSYAPASVSTLTAAGLTFAPLLPAATTVASGSNGGEISAVATWSSPSAGVLDIATGGALAWPAAGTFTVATSSTTATCTYTGVGSGGSSLTGVAYVSGSATGTVATGGAVTLTSPSAVNTGSFTAPPSGRVMVTASFVLTQTTATTTLSFGLAAKGTVTPLASNLINFTQANDIVYTPVVLPFYVTGLTAGTTYSYDLIGATDSSSDPVNIPAAANTSTTFSTTKAAPVLMTVQAV